MNKDDLSVVKRFYDLSKQADIKSHVIFGDFLNMNEISLLYEKKADYVSAFSLYGGYSYAERQIPAFYPIYNYDNDTEAVSKEDFPITCLLFEPANKKFADVLNHRDVLGALMNLGIERKMIGDILIQNQKIYIFCQNKMAELILRDLGKIKHTIVKGMHVEPVNLSLQPNLEEHFGFIASNRLDAFIACICNESRSKSVELILSEKVFINSKMISNYNHKLQPGDIISVRGFGRVLFEDFTNTTKKGRLRIAYSIYK